MTELELYIVCNLIRKQYEVDANSIFSKTYLDLMYHEAKKQPDRPKLFYHSNRQSQKINHIFQFSGSTLDLLFITKPKSTHLKCCEPIVVRQGAQDINGNEWSCTIFRAKGPSLYYVSIFSDFFKSIHYIINTAHYLTQK